jgi:hypothetical protein
MPPGKSQKKQSKGRGQPMRKNPAPVNWNKPATKKQKASRQRLAQANQTIQSYQPRTQRQVGVANRIRLPTVGMSDLLQHRITWVAGTVYVGNGTIGVTNTVYFALVSGAVAVGGTGGGFWIPFAPADVDVGATYAASIMKLYRRIRIRQAKVHLLTIQSSTTNNLVVGVAPCRGPPGAAEFSTVSNGTIAGQTLQNLMSISGMESCDSFENKTLDLTPYIAGGAGADQKEFAIANTIAATSEEGQVLDPIGVIPCAFQVAGNSTVTALQGSSTHNIVCEMVCDLIDFVGAVPVIDPISVAQRRIGVLRRQMVEPKEERRGRLLSELSALARDDKVRRDLSASPVRQP